MKHDELDDVLGRREDIRPSFGFPDEIMDRVKSEALAPPPIPFPWKRAMPGMIAGAVTLVSALVGFVQIFRTAAPPVPPQIPPAVTLFLETARAIHPAVRLKFPSS